MTTLTFLGPIEFATADGRGVEIDELDGALVTEVVDNGNGTFSVTYLDSSNVSHTDIFGADILNRIVTLEGNPAITGTPYSNADFDQRIILYRSTTAPGNTPGTPAAGDSNRWSPDNHDHGINPTDATARTSAANALAEAQATETSLNNHITNHPGATQAGPPPADSVGRSQLTALLRAELDTYVTSEEAQDAIASLLTEGTGITLTYDDAANTLTISSTATGPGRTLEELQDAVAAMLTEGNNITLNYDDIAGTLTITASGTGGAQSFGDLTGMIADNQIPQSIMRDSEFTAAAVRNLLSLTATEVNDLVTGATLVGTTLTLTQNDGSTIVLTLPSSGMATADGVVASGTLSGQTLTLTLSTGGTVEVDLAALSTDIERNALESKVEAQIDHLSDIIAHGENVGMETSVDGSHVQNVITFTIPQSIRDVPGTYNVKLTLEYAVQAGTQFRLPHDIMFAVAGTGALAGEVPARTHTGGQGIRGVFHISWLNQAITADAAAIQVTATVQNFTADMISFEDSSHATFTLTDEADTPGTPVALSGNAIETLYNNMPSTETALALTAGVHSWARTFNLDLGRELTEADDAKDMRIRFSYNQVTNRRVVDLVVNVGEFRSWTEFTTATGSEGVPVGNQRFPMSYGHADSDDLVNIWNRQGMVFRRGNSSGNHVLGIVIPAGNNATYAALSNFRCIVQLVPPISALEISGNGVFRDQDRARLLPEADTTHTGQIAKVQADGTWALGTDEGGTGAEVTANPTGGATAELETVSIGDTTFQVQVGRQAYIGAQATYDTANDRFGVDIRNDAIREPRLGDTVIFQLPDTFASNDNELSLAVQYDGGTATHALQNSHGDSVSTSELMTGATLEAVLVLIGTNRRWRMIEPPLDLTQAQVIDRTNTIFGVVSGQRLGQAVDAFVENFARTNSTGRVPFNRLPDLVVFKAGSRVPTSGEQGANDDRVSGEHVLWWNTDSNQMYVHDGGSGTLWNALTFGTAAFLVGSGTPDVNTGSPGSLFMEITRDGDGNITNWYIWTKNDSNQWVNRFEVPIQSDQDIRDITNTMIEEDTGSAQGIVVVHTDPNNDSAKIDFRANFTAGLFAVLPDNNGVLRDPQLAEWRRKTPGFDAHGNQYTPKRRFTGATGGTLATIAEGAFVTRNSITYRFRGFHHNDDYVDSPMFRHVYFTLTGTRFSSNIWRLWNAADAWVTTADPFGHHTSGGRAVYRGIAVDDDSALHDTTTVGDIYVVGNSNTQTFELKTVTALPTAGTAEYYWELVHAGQNLFMEVADEAAALAASSANDPVVYWWEA